jgi:hypothetical protein
LKGNTNGVEFQAYGLKHEKKILRVEVRLTTKNVIQAYSGEPDTSKQLKVMAKGSEHIFMDTFQYIVPRGNHYKMKQAKILIAESVTDNTMRRKMLRLLELVPKKKSLHTAQKSLNIRDIQDVMVKFWEIDVSPITLSKRHSNKKLDSLYSFFD